MNREEKLQEMVNFILDEGGNDSVLVTKATTTCLHLQNKEVDCCHKARAT
jgi:hypothetical protein